MNHSDEILDYLIELRLMTEWSDIANRDKSPSLFVAARRMEGKKTTETDCKMRMMAIEQELNSLRWRRKAAAMDAQDR